MRTKTYADAFKTIKTFAISKNLAYGNDKYVSTHDMMRMVRQAYFKKLSMAFQRYKSNVSGDTQNYGRLKVIWGKFGAFRLRDAFNWWKKKDQKQDLLDDMYYSGPVRAEYWEATREIENLKEFMRKERYGENEIEAMFNKVTWKTDGLLRKYIIRWRIRQTRKRLVPVVWDRWRQYVGMRKLVRY